MKELIDEMNDAVSGLLPLKTRHLGNRNNRWLVRSALQKAIRRARTGEALKCAEYLYDFDENYFWRSLATIAIEDIGPTSPIPVTWTLAMNRKSIRDNVLADKLARLLVTFMSQESLHRTRACCELDLGTLWALKESDKALYGYPVKDLLDIVDKDISTNQDLREVFMALALLRGRAPEFHGMKKPEKNPSGVYQALGIMAGKLPKKQARAAMLAYENPMDSMHMAYYPIAMMFHSSQWSVTFTSLKQHDERVLKGLSSVACDMHVPAGKLALKAFYTSLSKDYAGVRAIEGRNAVKAMGSLVFVEEGGLLHRGYSNDSLDTLRREQDYVFARACDCPMDLYPLLRSIVSKEIPRLNDKREWALRIHEKAVANN